MELSSLTPAEIASAAKADAAGVTIEARDNDGNLIDNGPAVTAPVVPAAAGKTKPEGVPDKFWNATTGEVDVAALSKSYTELEKARAKPAEPAKPAAPAKSAALIAAEAALAAAQAAEPAAPGADPAAAAPVQTTAVADATSEYARDGKLSDATYETLGKQGLTKHMVDTFIHGQNALVQAAVSEAHAVTGGAENFTAMVEWARVNATPQQISDYDAGVGNRATAKLAVADMYSKYQAAMGRDGTLISGGNNGPGANVGGYANQSEIMAAINDPRYKKDAGYRATVEAKLGKTADHIL
jgi:hypothetical protein